MTPLTLPQARIPLGWAMIQPDDSSKPPKRVPVEIDIEWMRAFLTMVSRVGGITGGESFETFLSLLIDVPQPDPRSRETFREVDELRNELASARSDVQRLVRTVDELAAALAEIRPQPWLLTRIEQIEDRLN